MTDTNITYRSGPVSPHEQFSARDAILGWMEEIAPYGIFTTDAEFRIRSWNIWLVTHSGLPAEKVLGRLLFEVFPEIQGRRLDEHFRRALAGEISLLSTALHKYLLPLPVTLRGLDGPHMLQTVRIAPLPAGDLVVGTITIIEDVTQRESQALILQRQQEHDRLLSSVLGTLLQSDEPLRDVAELFPKIAPSLGLDAFFHHLFDAETIMLRLHAAGGISPRQKEAMTEIELGQGLCGMAALQRKLLQLDNLQSDETLPANSLRQIGFRSCCCFPLLIGDRLLGTLSFATYNRDVIVEDEIDCLTTIAQYVAIAIDRGFREKTLRQAELSLRGHAENLEQKVTERTARLHETVAQLESFSYTVAHDLRAPIRALKGYSDILLSDFAFPVGAGAILERLQRASNRLDGLTRDLLKFSKIARQDVQLEPVDVLELIHDIVLLTPTLEDDVLVIHPPLGRVWAQRTLLQQCLSNLFDNAVKFTASGTRPRIVIRAEKRAGELSSNDPRLNAAFNPATKSEGVAEPSKGNAPRTELRQRLRIWVEDNGIGVAQEAHQKIFGIFERGSGLDHIEGTGIGLAIVARAVQQMSGSCGVESVPGQGSRFWLEFAFAENQAGATRPSEKPQG